MRTCDIQDCSGKHVAKGLCITHYNRLKYPAEKRYRQEEFTCDCCGATATRDARKHRYANSYCSMLCRDYARGCKMACKLPPTHWARMFGASSKWVPKPAARILECGWCGIEVATDINTKKFCSRPCKAKASKAARRGLEHNAIGTYSWAQIVKLWMSFDRACAYCANPTALTDIQAEHVTALSRGGANNLSNLLPSCGPCNSDKRELSLTEWAADRVRRRLPKVTTTWDALDTRYSHLALAQTPLKAA